jgi:hypothetical protein
MDGQGIWKGWCQVAFLIRRERRLVGGDMTFPVGLGSKAVYVVYTPLLRAFGRRRPVPKLALPVLKVSPADVWVMMIKMIV